MDSVFISASRIEYAHDVCVKVSNYNICFKIHNCRSTKCGVRIIVPCGWRLFGCVSVRVEQNMTSVLLLNSMISSDN